MIRQNNPETPEPVKPVKEQVVGVNIPYRGMVNHGVPNKTWDPHNHPEDDWASEQDPIISEHSDYEQKPLPVKIVGDSARFQRQWRTMRYIVDNVTPLLLVGKQDSRTKCYIYAEGDVYIGNDASTVANFGFHLTNTGTPFELEHNGAIWCVAKTSPQTVNVMIEFNVDIPNE